MRWGGGNGRHSFDHFCLGLRGIGLRLRCYLAKLTPYAQRPQAPDTPARVISLPRRALIAGPWFRLEGSSICDHEAGMQTPERAITAAIQDRALRASRTRRLGAG